MGQLCSITYKTMVPVYVCTCVMHLSVLVLELQPMQSCTECATGVLAAGKKSCLQSPCLNGGSCRQKGDSFICDCSSAYLGLSCEALSKSVVSCDVNEGIFVLLQTGFSVKGEYGAVKLFYIVQFHLL